MKFKIITETPMGMNEVKEALSEIKTRDNELSFRAQKTMDYLEQVLTLSAADAKSLFTKLSKLDVPRLKDTHFHKLVDILPLTPKDVKTVLQGYAVTITNENLKKIADTIAEYAQKK